MAPMTTSAQRAWLAASACAVGFLLVLGLVALGLMDAIDAALIAALGAPAPAEMLEPLHFITDFGSTWAIITVAALVLVAGWVGGRSRDGALGALVIAFGALVIELTKRIVGRSRPEVLEPILVEVGFSFPSGHTANATIAYGILAVLVGRLSLPAPVRIGIQVVLVAIVVAVGLSRIWLGVHFPSDVAAGWLLGGAFVAGYVAVSQRGSPGSASEVAGADPAAPRSGPPAAE